jgi:hypothetical protein
MNRPRPLFAALAATGILARAILCDSAYAEDLRTLVAGSAVLSSENPEGSRLAMGYNDAIAVSLSKDSSFIQGMEIELKVPAAVMALPGGFAYELWRKVDPLPEKSRFGYRGERIITQPLPSRASLVLQVPIRKDHSLKPGPYATLLPVVVEAKDFPFLFRLIAVSKGFSSEVENAQFQVRVRPILTDEGALGIRLRFPEGQGERTPIVVSVDDRKVDPSALLLLKAGIHRLHIASENYREENRSFTIEQGKILDMVIDLQDTTPVLLIEAPDSALVLLDGARIDHVTKPQMQVEAGEHSATCRIGDYTVTRKFTAYRGKTYRLVLAIDLQVQESP